MSRRDAVQHDAPPLSFWRPRNVVVDQEAAGHPDGRGRRGGHALAPAQPHRHQPDAPRHRRDHRRRHLRAHGPGGRAVCRPRHRALVRDRRLRLPLRGALLRRIRVPDPDCRLRVHLRLCNARRVHGLDHRLGPDPRVPVRGLHGVGRLQRLFRGAHEGNRLRHSREVRRRAPQVGRGRPRLPRHVIDSQPSGDGPDLRADRAAGDRHPRVGALQQPRRHDQAVDRAGRHRLRHQVREHSQLAAVHSREHRYLRSLRPQRRRPRVRRGVLRLHRLRCGEHRRAGGEEPPARPPHRHPRVARHLHRALHPDGARHDRPHAIHEPQRAAPGVRRHRRGRPGAQVAHLLHQHRRHRRARVGGARHAHGAAAHLLRHGA